MELRPTTEKVPARRGMALVVGLAALATVGVLVARPWDHPAPTRLPGIASPSPGAVALNSATPPSVAPQTELASPSARPIPTPDLAPLEPLGMATFDSPPSVPLAHCLYAPSRGGSRVLVTIEVAPPVVFLDSTASVSDIPRVGWWLELERNDQGDASEGDWEVVGRSGGQVVRTVTAQPAGFSALTIANRDTDIAPDVAYRVRLVVQWYTRNFEIAGRADLVADSYREANDTGTGTWPAFCRAVRPPAR